MINTDKLTENFFNDKEIYLSFQYHSDKLFNSLNSVFARILNRLDLHFLLDTITTSLRELILNASKANAKRAFFNKHKLNIENLDDYQKGMLKFKKIVNDSEKLSQELKDTNFRVTIKINKKTNGISIQINNNIKITDFEKERIKFRMKLSKSNSNFSETFDKVYDPSEGAGLGIMLVFLLLANAGINTKNFKIIFGKNEISTNLFIPFKLKEQDLVSKIKDKIIEQVETLPTFPENVLELQKMCNNSSVPIEEISERVSMDPSLTADVLKIANSAGFISSKRIETVNEAVIIIGLKNLNSLISVAAAKKIIEKKYKRFEVIWNHCVKTAFYARAIAINTGHVNIQDKVFIAGLLHDIGKIILLTVDANIAKQINTIIKDKHIRTPNIIEEIAIGTSHSTIGSIITSKWNFPDFLVDSIKNHHTPFSSKKENFNINKIVYLANLICNIENKKSDFLFIESDILKSFKIKNENEFNNFHKKLQHRYELHHSTLRLV